MNKKLLFLLLLTCILIGFLFLKKDQKITVSNFEECVRESGIIMESYPRQCKSFDGKIYIEEIKNSVEPTIKIDEINSGSLIDSPLTIKGSARGSWFFEASFPVKLIDKENNTIASGIAMATANSLTDDFVPFECKLYFNVPEKIDGTLVFKNDNPSGLPENDVYYKIPVVVNEGEKTVKVKIYFANDNIDKEVTCEKVFYIEREVTNTKAIATAAIEELLKGVNESEKSKGYRTLINDGVKLNKLVIENGTAKIDFSEQLEKEVGGSCRVSFIRKQIEETLKQFPTVKSVIISINGDSEYILQP